MQQLSLVVSEASVSPGDLRSMPIFSTADFQDETSSVKALHLDGVNEKRGALVSSPPAVSMMDSMQ